MIWLFFALQLALLWWEGDALFRHAASIRRCGREPELRGHPTHVASLAVSVRRGYLENVSVISFIQFVGSDVLAQLTSSLVGGFYHPNTLQEHTAATVGDRMGRIEFVCLQVACHHCVRSNLLWQCCTIQHIQHIS